MAFEKKTWQFNDLITEHELNRIEDGIHEVHEELTPNQKATLSLKEGIQAVNVLSNSALSVQFEGRTLVNLLGRDGNFEVEGSTAGLGRGWIYAGAGTKVSLVDGGRYGNRAQRIEFTGTGARYIERFIDITPGKYYLAIAETRKISGASTPCIRAWFNDGWAGTVSSEFNHDEYGVTTYRFKPTSGSQARIRVEAGNSECIVEVDGYRVFEITEEEYNALDGMTDEEIAALYPYVDSVQHTRNPYVISYGKNLLPSFTSGKWQLHQNAKVISPYELELNADGAAQSSNLYIPVIPNTTYTLSYETNQVDVAYINVGWLDENDNLISWTEEHKEVNTFTSPANAVKARIAVTNKGAGVFYFKNPQLELGDTATEFEEHSPTYLFGKDVVLAEGEKAYRNANGEWRKWQEWEQVELDGIFNWTISRSYTGHKTVRTENIVSLNKEDGYTLEQYKSVKFDGKILNSSGSDTVTDSAIFYNSSGEGIRSGTIAITVSNQDSGWGQNYTPTPEEIKAYFNGWQMNNGTFGQPYNGTGTKTWIPLGDADNNRATTTLPTITSPTITEGKITHYQLHYRLAEPREVPVEFEGSLRVHEGLNQIEVGTGVVVRERANLAKSPQNNWDWNYPRVSPDILAKYRVDKIYDFYKNQKVDTPKWTIRPKDYNPDTTNGERGFLREGDFDPTAAYHVTYFVLDKHLFTAELGGVQAEYNTNFATRLEENEKTLIEQVRKLSIVENELLPLLASSEIVDHNLHVANPPLGWYVRYANGLQITISPILTVVEIVAENEYSSIIPLPTPPAAFTSPVYRYISAVGRSTVGGGNRIGVNIIGRSFVDTNYDGFRIFNTGQFTNTDASDSITTRTIESIQYVCITIGRWK